MAEQSGPATFLDDVFPAELQEIEQRRDTVRLDAKRLGGPPSTHQELVGLAISGGGIRSATFSLGVVHALAKKGVLKFADYISTVSGGGYTGSFISSLLNDPDRTWSEVHRDTGQEEPKVLRHLRNSSNYLSPGGLLSRMRLPALLLRGLLLNLFLFLPFIMAAVFVTELAYGDGRMLQVPPRYGIAVTVVLFVVIVIALPFVLRFQEKRFGWPQRNVSELLLAAVLVVVLFFVMLVPFTLLLQAAIDLSWNELASGTGDSGGSLSQLEDDLVGLQRIFTPQHYWKWLIVLAAVAAFTLAGKASNNLAKARGKFALIALSLIGPGVILAIYLLLCVMQIDSPFMSANLHQDVDMAMVSPEHGGGISDDLKIAFRKKGLSLEKAAIKSLREKDDDPSSWSIKLADGTMYTLIDEGERFRLARPDKKPLVAGLWDGPRDYIFFGLFAILLIFNGLFLDVNISSLHGFYRDRLSKAYLVQLEDDIVVHNDGQKLSELSGKGTIAPYHLINVTLNLQASTDPDLRGRNADFFIMSKRFLGGDRTGYCITKDAEELDRNLTLGTAMAVSAAAASPNMGQTTVPSLVFMMTLLNIRLGYWHPHPGRVAGLSWHQRLLRRGPGPSYLLREAASQLHDRGKYVNISDGGHLENLAIYELLKRRCAFIIAIDGEADPDMRFKGLIELTRLARIDMGIEITVDLDEIRKSKAGHGGQHWALAKVDYGGGEHGQILYVKSSVTGDENEYVLEYRALHPSFPHESTADQFFSERQFEAYRALGEHVGEDILKSKSALKALPISFRDEERELHDTTFSELSVLEFSKLLEIAEWRDIPEGTVVAHEGGEMADLMLVYSGCAAVESKAGPRVELQPGQFIGEMSFVTASTATATVRISKAARCLAWRQSDLNELLARHAVIAVKLGIVMGQDLTRKLVHPPALE